LRVKRRPLREAVIQAYQADPSVYGDVPAPRSRR